MLLSGRVEEWLKIFIPERTSAKQYNQTTGLDGSGVEQDYARLAPKCRPSTGRTLCSETSIGVNETEQPERSWGRPLP